jgi:hypothetical protein
MIRTVKAAGIACASGISQVAMQHNTCAQHGCPWLHDVCTDAALQELVARWYRLTPDVRGAIMHLMRGRRRPCVSDDSPGAGTSAKLSHAGSDNCATVSPELSRRRSFRADVGPHACKDLTTIARRKGRRDFRGRRTGLEKKLAPPEVFADQISHWE